MFGKNKISQEEMERLREAAEEDERFFSRMEEQKDMFDAGVAELHASYRQMKTDAAQVLENIKNASLLAEENAKVEASLGYSLNDYRERLEAAEANQAGQIEQFQMVAKEAERLVDENKHFTSPSKYLSELPAGLRARNQAYMQFLKDMTDYSKQMVVLALNAAIEAGRMGDSGKQFVTAAEDIRTYASNYDRSLQALAQELEQSNQRVDELEEQVKHLVKLLKSNNISTARLMRACDDVLQEAKANQSDALSREAASLRAQVTILKNADEEIIKSEERNRMQMEDLMEEIRAQQAGQKEILEIVDPVFQRAADRRGGIITEL